MVKKEFFIFVFILFFALALNAQVEVSKKSGNAFPLVSGGNSAQIFVDEDDFESVKKTASLFASDLEMATGVKSKVKMESPFGKYAVVIGTLGKNKFINSLIAEKKLDVSKIKGGWEQYLIKTLENPVSGISKLLVIVGSDRRGASYGVFSVSEACGVSPLYWWADVPVKKSKEIFLKPVNFSSKSPSVKYRGIFINDEGWGLHRWSRHTFEKESGGIGPKTYEKVCELILRLKGNMLAPAMHPCTKAFYKFPENKKVADSFGIIITTSHCEPLLFNNATEWQKKTMGEWNYLTNKDGILSVLDLRVSEAAAYENIYTMGMRGLHDAKMENVEGREVEILEGVMKDQREILSKYIKKPIAEIPQIFVPYKETLDIYEKQMNLPDDITLVWPDDNYGYLKRLSNSEEQKRSGGSGVYYHLSYLGGPHDYLWLCTTSPVLMFEELKKAYDFGADRYWLLNVGDIKPMELGMLSFFDLAWDISKATDVSVNRYHADWLSKIFGMKHRKDLQFVLEEFYRLSWSRKPEFMGWEREWDAPKWKDILDTDFSFENYNDAQQRIADYKKIVEISDKIQNSLPEEYKPAFFELAGYPVKASWQMNRKFLMAQLNHELAAKKDFAGANWAAEESLAAYNEIEKLNADYNALLCGKWNQMMMLAPGWCAKYHLMPELSVAENVKPRAVDLAPKKEKSALKGCAVINLKNFKKKIENGNAIRIVEGIGYDKHSIQLGNPKEKTADNGLNASRIEYEFNADENAQKLKIHVYTVPFFPVHDGKSTKFGVSVDGGKPIVFENKFKEFSGRWKDQVLQNGAVEVREIPVKKSRKHTISFICADAGVMIQRVVIDWGGLKKTYVGPSAN